ncbi:dolichyl-phosphate-mannose--protein mannosyltransferase [Nocardia sp. bgisy118]|uniref:dolichyl-phosphate-mannose--protein mannosyltransferase n=1 Tax=Nocardia sp. bgisy118 TaxID=3413786 RepID=UPI003F4A04D0
MIQLTEPRPVPSALTSPRPLRPIADFGPEDRLRGWLVTAFLTALAAVTRFTNLNYPTDGGHPVFDEKYYASQGWEMLTNGMWIDDNPGFSVIVHPPVGKMAIALGEALFGYNAWGWRFSAAVAGTVLVLIVIRIARRLTRSTAVGAIAGILMVAEGVTFVQSRIGMLDIFMALFATAAFGCLVVDRDEIRARTAYADLAGRTLSTPYGPRLGVRWWRFGAGVFLGLACGTKWSGIYFLAAFFLMSLAFTAVARRSYGVVRPWVGTLVRDLVPSMYALIVIPLGLYLASYGGWFASETGINRYAVGNHVGAGGFFSFVPDALRSLWYNSGAVLEFHTHLTNSAGNHHPWESKPWTWPMGLRPMLYYFPDPGTATGCGDAPCVKAIVLIGTPAVWWLAFPVLLWAAWRSVAHRDWRYATVLMCYLAAWLPWFASLDRQMYFFYATAMAPFLVMLLAIGLGDILGRVSASSERGRLRLLIVCLYLGIVIADFAWIWPILTATPISMDTWNRQLWLPSWR